MLYMGADNTLYHPNAAMTIGAFRAYFKLIGITAGDLEESGDVSDFVLNFDGAATGITETITVSTPTSNGYFTLGGQRLNGEPAQKGIYIHNGRKVVVK